MTTSTAHRTAIAALAVATALTLGMTASTWNPYTRAVDNATAERMEPAPEPTPLSYPVMLTVWEPVSQELGDALAEGGAPDATTRDWESCEVKYDPDATLLRCPDGYTEIW
jgi:hypothetical protein